MTRCLRRLHYLMRFAGLLLTLMGDAGRFLLLCLHPSPALAAENLFLRKQLARYQERHTTPRRATNATRLALVWLGRWFEWRQVLAIVQPTTFLRWHRQGFQLFWRWKSRPGRPRIPAELQALIRQMAQENPTWGQERIANELLLKLGRGCLREPYANICRATAWETQEHDVNLNAGLPLSAIMPKASWRVNSAS